MTDPVSQTTNAEAIGVIAALEAKFKRRVQITAENSAGHFSDTWVFWGNRSDFYFGAKGALGSMKVSLHANGRGYLAYVREFHKLLANDGIELGRTMEQWRLPEPGDRRAVQVASILLPATFFRITQTKAKLAKALILGVSDNLGAEINIFRCRGYHEGIESELRLLGHPLFVTHLDGGVSFLIFVREVPYDNQIIPTSEQINATKHTVLDKSLLTTSVDEYQGLNAILWSKPVDDGILRIIEVGGVKVHR